MSATRSHREDTEQRGARKQRKRPAERGKGFFARLTAPFRKLMAFLHDVRVEMSRVVWPSKEETYTYTFVVVVAVVVVALWVGLWDTILTQVVAMLKLYD